LTRRAPPSALPPGDVTSAFILAGDAIDLGRAEIVPVVGKPFDRALRLTTTTMPGVEWKLYLTCPVPTPIHAGDVLLARFWLRCEDSMSGDGFTTFVFESPERIVEFRAGAGGDWREMSVPFRAPRAFARGEAHVRFSLGFDRQTLDLGGIELLNYGAAAEIEALPRTVITYAGRQPDAPWRAAALKRIEQHRKGELTARVTDAAGRPVPQATVRVTQRRHAFGFGSAVTVEHLLGRSADCDRYREIVERHFNTAVFENDMKWQENDVEPRAGVDEALDWLLQRDIRVRGHNLLWPSWKWLPETLRALASNPDELRRRTHQRVSEAVAKYRGKLDHWDVVNEPYSERDLMDVLGQDVMVEWFKLAKQADPSCQMYLNDYGIFDGGPSSGHRRHFHETIRWMLERGAPVDGIGIQSHFGALPAPPERMLAVLDQFSTFGLPIESTELSLNMLDRQLQADYLRDYLITMFSHPNVYGVTLWGFWEGRHWRPDAALFERDWTPRPMAEAWMDLAHREWKTDLTLTTDATGNARARAFCGQYDVQAALAGVSSPTHAASVVHERGGEVTVVLASGVER
jgi:GH35 family endo-1,4-beta-xylanase